MFYILVGNENKLLNGEEKKSYLKIRSYSEVHLNFRGTQFNTHQKEKREEEYFLLTYRLELDLFCQKVMWAVKKHVLCTEVVF